MLLYALTVLISAFLLFQIEPTIAKMILPWFGGASNVWTTCLLFFQIVLFLGYLYAHAVVRYLRPRAQVTLHISLLAVSLLALPVLPNPAWKPTGSEEPVLRILGLLAVTIGIPYFLLSTTGPLMQSWYARRFQGGIPYRLYALSNVGSMLALVSYPVLIEPAFSTRLQSLGWSCGYAAFIALCGLAAFSVRGDRGAAPVPAADPAPGQSPDWKTRAWWILLPACAAVLLLAVTNFLSQDVAAIPFLWILPLVLYLLSFILCFDRESWYRRSAFLKFFAVALVSMAYGIRVREDVWSVKGAIPLVCIDLFICCMVCRGELVRLKPDPRHLTSFYLMISAGGALGGIFVGLLAPNWFSGFFELQIGLAATAVLVTLRYRERSLQWGLIAASTLALVTYLGLQIPQSTRGARVVVRNFYGGLKVVDKVEAYGAMRVEMHGVINHGQQYLDPERRTLPVSYFSAKSGVGLALREARQNGPIRVGVVGLGAGTLAAYGQSGDYYRFYGINPLVIQLARSEFTFLSDSKAKIDVIPGDGRLSLSREPDQQFDVLIADAFSGDSVPVHLMTREAFQLYFRHLKPTGVLAVHVTNKYLNIAPLVHQIVSTLGKECRVVDEHGQRGTPIFPSTWVLINSRADYFQQPLLAAAAQPIADTGRLRVWSDDYSNLFQVLR